MIDAFLYPLASYAGLAVASFAIGWMTGRRYMDRAAWKKLREKYPEYYQ